MATPEEIAFRKADIAAIEDDVATIDGVNVPGVFTPARVGETPEVGGFAISLDASFYLRPEVYPGGVRPKIDDLVVVKGRTYRVAKFEDPPDAVVLELGLVSQSGN